MSRWKSVVTTQGLNILSNITETQPMNIVRIKCGSGKVAESELENLTDVTDYECDIPITANTHSNDTTYQVTCKLENTDITTGFNLTQIGLYCTLGTGTTEYLYQVLQCTDDGDVIPAYADSKGFTATYLINLTFSNSENVNIEVVHNEYATKEDLDALVDNVSDTEVVVGKEVSGKMKLYSVPIDETVASGSTNPVTSGAVATALASKLDNVQTLAETGSITFGGLLLQWGKLIATEYVSSISVTFEQAFSEIYNVQVTNRTLSSNVDSLKIESLYVNSANSTGFSVGAISGNNISGTGFWLAIGKA